MNKADVSSLSPSLERQELLMNDESSGPILEIYIFSSVDKKNILFIPYIVTNVREHIAAFDNFFFIFASANIRFGKSSLLPPQCLLLLK